ncbi:MAG: signal peptide peptidase SppA [Planctomycetota bacterium]|nr:MAG: signal peptide peptidase SppA [Planctomycetota bacterium]
MSPSKRQSSFAALVTSSALVALLGAAPAFAQTNTFAQKAKKAAPKAAAVTSKKATKAAPKKAPKTKIHLVSMAGSYADQAGGGQSLQSLLMGGGVSNKSVSELIAQLQALANNKSADIVLFDFTKPIGMDRANLPEVAAAIHALKAKHGKRTYAYLKNANDVQFQLAAMCGRIYMAEMGTLDLPSPSMSTLHMKKAFDLFGIGMDVVRCGDFKGAVEPYLLPKISDHLRNHYLAMLRSINHGIVERIAKGRDLDPKWVRAMQKKRIFTAKQAKNEGLVDALVPWRDALPTLVAALELGTDYQSIDVLKKKTKRATVNPMLMLTNMFRKKRPERIRKDAIAVLHLQGTIVDGFKPAPGNIVSGPTVKEIQRLTKSDKIKAVVVRVNSPGGSATASEAILVALKELMAKKPIVISQGSLAASGGYWISCTGSKIFAQPATITGSIGVFGTKPNFGKIAGRLGLHESPVALDESAGMTSLFRGWTPEEKARIQSFVNATYDRFLDRVAAMRKLPRSVVEKLAGGRVWSGLQAKKLGLVDELGGLQDAIAFVRKAAKIKGKIEIKHFPKPKSFMESLAESFGGVKAALPAPATLRLIAKQHGSLEHALQILHDALTHKRPWNVWALSPTTLQLR